jgi:hypothetical protein
MMRVEVARMPIIPGRTACRTLIIKVMAVAAFHLSSVAAVNLLVDTVASLHAATVQAPIAVVMDMVETTLKTLAIRVLQGLLAVATHSPRIFQPVYAFFYPARRPWWLTRYEPSLWL